MSADEFPHVEDRDDATLREHGMVPPSQAAMIIAHGMNNSNGKRVLYVALDAHAMDVLSGKEPALYALPGVPGLEEWELVVIGPDGVAPFLLQVQSVAPERPDNTDPMASHGQ